MSTMITGGAGFIGANLARALLERGERPVLFDISTDRKTISDINERVGLVRGNMSLWTDVLSVVKKHSVKRIYHLGSMITSDAEENPQAAYNINVGGTFNILEASRLLGVERVVFVSSTGTYGTGISGEVEEDSLQRPVTMYGTTKLVGELLGRYYRRKFGLDFRAVRFPTIIGPGVKSRGAAFYHSCIIEAPALGRPVITCLEEETKIPLMYFKDAVRCLLMLGDADKEAIKTAIYTVSGITPLRTAREIISVVRKHVPAADIKFQPEPVLVDFLRSISININDARAKREWGWNPQYSLEETVEDFIKEVRDHRELYE